MKFSGAAIMFDGESGLSQVDGPHGYDPGSSVRGYAWGYNILGGLGIGSVARALLPVSVALPDQTVDVQGGTDFTVALTSTGQVWTWGGNRYGQLGDGSSNPRLTPHRVQLPGRAKVRGISVGSGHVLALSHDGPVFSWGRNSYGQLGDGTVADRHTPVRVAADSVARLATGVASSHAVTRSGALLTWGRPIDRGDTSTVRTADPATPRSLVLPDGEKAALVDAGERHLVVLTRRDQLLTFGVDPAGKPLPDRMPTDRSWGKVVSISSGDQHTVALTSTGKVLAWGANYYGQLGTRDTANRDTPVLVRIPNLRGRVVDVIAGGDSVLIRSNHHEVYVWGQGRFGQTGNGKTADETRPRPVTISHESRVTGVHAGRYHHVVRTNHHHH
jgi:alpha-tubulin suppressor-like RCC1 family protein